jgi:hypothetical protein
MIGAIMGELINLLWMLLHIWREGEGTQLYMDGTGISCSVYRGRN